MNVLHWFSDPFRSEFMQRALLATIIIGVVSPVVGVWVVLRRMANLGDAMGHGTLAGVAIAYSAGINVGYAAKASAKPVKKPAAKPAPAPAPKACGCGRTGNPQGHCDGSHAKRP